MAKKIKEEEIKAQEERDLELVRQEKFRMNLLELFVVDLIPNVKRVVVKNLGGGDLYVSDSELKYDESDLVRPNTEKGFENPNMVIMYSFSRPLVVIEQYK